MSSTTTPPRPLRTTIGIVLIAVGVCLLCWPAFQILRGPSECGGPGSVACPDGFLPAILGGFASFFVVIPVGIALSPKIAGLTPMLVALISGGLAATFYVSRFVADPVTESTVVTWIVVGVLGTIALLALFAVVRVGPDAEEVQARLRAIREAQDAAVKAKPTSSQASAAGSSQTPSASARATATARTPDGTEVDLGMDTIRQLLLHGLTNGELATKVEVGRIAPDHKPDVQRLLDLHQRGVIDDDALRDALAALRAS